MKIIIAVNLCLFIFIAGVTNLTVAQGLEIECDDDVIIRNGVDIQFLNVEPTDTHIVTALGIDTFDPVIAVFNQQQSGGCNDDAAEASSYVVDLPTTDIVIENELNAQMTFNNGFFMRVVAGEFDDLEGEVVIMVEGLTFNGTPDRVNLTVTDDMIQSGLPVTAYVIERTPGLDLSLAVVDDNGVPLQDSAGQSVQCDDAGDNELCWGAHASLIDSFTSVSDTQTTEATAISPMLSIPLTANDVESIIPFQITRSAEDTTDTIGEYIFILHYGVGELDIADGLASVTTTDNTTSLSCDGEVVVSDAIEVTIPRMDAQYTANLIAKEAANPILGVIDSAGGGACHIVSSDGTELSAQLPIIEGFNPSLNNTRALLIGANARLLTGLFNDTSGSYLLAIDGLTIPPDGTPDIVSVKVTPSMVAAGQPISAFIIAKTLDLNPQLALVSAEQEILSDAEGMPITCTNTSLPESCWGDYEDMSSAEIILGTDNTVLGVGNDVMLRIPLTEELIGTTLNFMGTGEEGSSGEYILIVHLSTSQSADEQN